MLFLIIVFFFQMPQHEKYMKTTIAGIARGMADYALVLVNAPQPPTHMTRHHLSLCIGMGIPVVVVLTKTDRCPHHIFESTRDEVKSILKGPTIQKRPFLVKNTMDIASMKDKVFTASPWTPVLAVSAVTGKGLNLLRELLAALPPRRCHEKKHRHKPFEYLVEDVYTVSGVGTVLSGFVTRGEWKRGEPLFIGPLKNGELYHTVPRSAHVAKTPVDNGWAGHSVCFAISKPTRTNRKFFTKGMVASKGPFVLSKSFVADVYWTKGISLGSGVTIQSNRFEVTVNLLHNKLSTKILNIVVDGETQETVRQGVRASVTFEIKYQPTYVRPGMKIILRDGHVRGYGVIKSVSQS
jgi:elongation factor 1-alpha